MHGPGDVGQTYGWGMSNIISECLAPLMFLVCIACAQDMDDPAIKVYEDAARSMTGSIDLSGQVVDSEGKAINGVTIKYFFQDLQDSLSIGEIDYQRIKVDGDFRFKQSNISSVHLTFLKEGMPTSTPTTRPSASSI